MTPQKSSQQKHGRYGEFGGVYMPELLMAPIHELTQVWNKIKKQKQCLTQFKSLPDMVIACVGGGSNTIGIFSAFLDHPEVKLVGVEAGGHGFELGEHAARFHMLTRGVSTKTRQICVC